MSTFGLLLGVVLVVLGVIFLFTGLTGKGIRVKTAGAEISEEDKISGENARRFLGI